MLTTAVKYCMVKRINTSLDANQLKCQSMNTTTIITTTTFDF